MKVEFTNSVFSMPTSIQSSYFFFFLFTNIRHTFLISLDEKNWTFLLHLAYIMKWLRRINDKRNLGFSSVNVLFTLAASVVGKLHERSGLINFAMCVKLPNSSVGDCISICLALSFLCYKYWMEAKYFYIRWPGVSQGSLASGFFWRGVWYEI